MGPFKHRALFECTGLTSTSMKPALSRLKSFLKWKAKGLYLGIEATIEICTRGCRNLEVRNFVKSPLGKWQLSSFLREQWQGTNIIHPEIRQNSPDKFQEQGYFPGGWGKLTWGWHNWDWAWKEAEAKYMGEGVEQLLSAYCMPNLLPPVIILNTTLLGISCFTYFTNRLV